MQWGTMLKGPGVVTLMNPMSPIGDILLYSLSSAKSLRISLSYTLPLAWTRRPRQSKSEIYKKNWGEMCRLLLNFLVFLFFSSFFHLHCNKTKRQHHKLDFMIRKKNLSSLQPAIAISKQENGAERNKIATIVSLIAAPVYWNGGANGKFQNAMVTAPIYGDIAYRYC